MDDFNTLSNRLLLRCPAVGIQLAEQLINDSWHTLQSRQQWSFRRKSFIIAPPTLYNVGQVSTNKASGNPTLLTGVNTNWTFDMVGRQIRVSGLMFPFYTIVGLLSPTALLLDQPWAGADVSGQSYTILQAYYPMPSDFGYLYAVVSLKDSLRLFLGLTESELAVLDPQRVQVGQTLAAVFYDYTPQYGGIIGPAISVTDPVAAAPVSTTSTGYTFVANATFVVQVVASGVSGVAQYRWLRSGQSTFGTFNTTSDQAVDLSDGVMLYWPDGVNYVNGNIYIINCQSIVSAGTPRLELWPAPTFGGYLYPAIYIAKEGDLTVDNPSLPPFIANRGEVLLEMALEKCAEWPGTDTTLNPYYNLKQAQYHAGRATDMMVDLERNDDELTIDSIGYQDMGLVPGPWNDGMWKQSHAPWLIG